MAFDPDQYLAQKAPPQAQGASGGFDPDSYLAAKTAPSPVPSGKFRDTVGGVPGPVQDLPKPQESFKGTVDRLTKQNNLAVTTKDINANLMSIPSAGVSAMGRLVNPSTANTAFQNAGGLSGLLTRAGANGAIGAVSNPDHPVVGGLVGAGLSTAAEGVGNTAGKLGDWLMQKAVGMKKYLPGVGSTIADNGVWGTKAGMASDVESALGKHNSALDDAVGRIQGPIDSTKVSSKVGEHISDYKTGDISPAATAPEREAVRSRSNDIANRGDVTPQDALGLKRLAGNEGYNAGRPLANLDSKLAQTESGAYGDELKDAYGRTYPGEENAVASANDNMSALMKAKQGLDTPTTIRAGVPFTTLTGGLIGSALGGGVGTAAGVATAAAARSPLLQSIGAQALTKAAPIAKNATPYMLQALSNKSNPSQ